MLTTSTSSASSCGIDLGQVEGVVDAHPDQLHAGRHVVDDLGGGRAVVGALEAGVAGVDVRAGVERGGRPRRRRRPGPTRRSRCRSRPGGRPGRSGRPPARRARRWRRRLRRPGTRRRRCRSGRWRWSPTRPPGRGGATRATPGRAASRPAEPSGSSVAATSTAPAAWRRICHPPARPGRRPRPLPDRPRARPPGVHGPGSTVSSASGAAEPSGPTAPPGAGCSPPPPPPTTAMPTAHANRFIRFPAPVRPVRSLPHGGSPTRSPCAACTKSYRTQPRSATRWSRYGRFHYGFTDFGDDP